MAVPEPKQRQITKDPLALLPQTPIASNNQQHQLDVVRKNTPIAAQPAIASTPPITGNLLKCWITVWGWQFCSVWVLLELVKSFRNWKLMFMRMLTGNQQSQHFISASRPYIANIQQPQYFAQNTQVMLPAGATLTTIPQQQQVCHHLCCFYLFNNTWLKKLHRLYHH